VNHRFGEKSNFATNIGKGPGKKQMLSTAYFIILYFISLSRSRFHCTQLLLASATASKSLF